MYGNPGVLWRLFLFQGQGLVVLRSVRLSLSTVLIWTLWRAPALPNVIKEVSNGRRGKPEA
jgi:hypothetical protein